jgi:hypothetical protein
MFQITGVAGETRTTWEWGSTYLSSVRLRGYRQKLGSRSGPGCTPELVHRRALPYSCHLWHLRFDRSGAISWMILPISCTKMTIRELGSISNAAYPAGPHGSSTRPRSADTHAASHSRESDDISAPWLPPPCLSSTVRLLSPITTLSILEETGAVRNPPAPGLAPKGAGLRH